jgi:hypothetical protein
VPEQMTATTRPDQWLYDQFNPILVGRAKAALRKQNTPLATPTEEVRRLCEVMSLAEADRDEALRHHANELDDTWRDGFVAAATWMRVGRA